MNDNGDEEISEELQALVDGTSAMMEILSKSEDAHMALQILASTTSCMLCSMAAREDVVREEFDMFVEAIRRSVFLAKKSRMTAWIEGTPH